VRLGVMALIVIASPTGWWRTFMNRDCLNERPSQNRSRGTWNLCVARRSGLLRLKSLDLVD
jgi:hypothetical protein